ncbi:MAG: heavy metal-associated domain-containing protein [Pirellulales bacterium]
MHIHRKEIVCAILLLFTLSVQVQRAGSTQGSRAGKGKTSIVVEEMHCKSCARKIAAKLYTVPGVKSVSVSVKTKTLTITSQQGRSLSLRQLAEAVEKAKNRALRIVGPMGAYEYSCVDSKPSNSQTLPLTSVIVEEMSSELSAQRIIKQLVALQGVSKVEVERSAKKLIVTIQPQAKITPWSIWEAVEKGGSHAVLISGPQGTLSQLQSQATAPHRPARHPR